MTWVEHMLHSLGAHPSFADAVLGDMAEERARRAAEDGAGAARWWYACEAFRSAPHLLWNAALHGGFHGRVRAAALLAAAACAPIVFLLNGPPTCLVVDGDVAEGIVVNSVRPIQLSTRALDATGHVLEANGVRYEWASGVPLSVSPTGVVTCTRPGDAAVRASLGAMVTSVRIRCRPAYDVRARA